MTQERKDELYEQMVAWICENNTDTALFHLLHDKFGMTKEELHDHSIENLDVFFCEEQQTTKFPYDNYWVSSCSDPGIKRYNEAIGMELSDFISEVSNMVKSEDKSAVLNWVSLATHLTDTEFGSTALENELQELYLPLCYVRNNFSDYVLQKSLTMDTLGNEVIYGNTSYQVCVGLHTPSSGRLYGYYKLNAPVSTGNFNIIKQTSNGQNLSGWKFNLYFDASCTQLFAGPYSTSSTGRISFTGTTPGTYYIKEIGHTNAAIESKYACTSTNPQKIVVTAGQTSSVTFVNTLRPGTLNIKKVTSDGKNLSGWQFSIYSNAACTTLVSGPHTSNSSGAISVSNLKAGTYYVKEVGHQTASIASQY